MVTLGDNSLAEGEARDGLIGGMDWEGTGGCFVKGLRGLPADTGEWEGRAFLATDGPKSCRMSSRSLSPSSEADD